MSITDNTKYKQIQSIPRNTHWWAHSDVCCFVVYLFSVHLRTLPLVWPENMYVMLMVCYAIPASEKKFTQYIYLPMYFNRISSNKTSNRNQNK